MTAPVPVNTYPLTDLSLHCVIGDVPVIVLESAPSNQRTQPPSCMGLK